MDDSDSTARPGDPTRVFEDLSLYEQWDRDYYHPSALALYDRAISGMLDEIRVAEGSTVLDAGCGPGVHSIRAARRGAEVLGIDVSRTALDEARRRAEAAGVADRIELRQEDLTALSLPSDAFSAVFCWGVVIHIPEVGRALDELVRVLAPGGRLALQLTNADAWDHLLERVARALLRRPQPWEPGPLGEGRWFEQPGGGDLWVWRVDAACLVAHLEGAGLRLVSRRPVELTELQWRVPKAVRRPLLAANDLWQRKGWAPEPCATTAFVFEKPGAPGS
jgi:2-polyprenyl-3-methyl-5-hydroxy-6-metoxy-1,4-benzoquinol methylase